MNRDELKAQIDELMREHPTATADSGKDEHNDEEDCANAAKPAFQSADQWREQKSKERCESDRDQNIAPEVERRDDERREKHCPDSDEGVGRGGLVAEGRGHR